MHTNVVKLLVKIFRFVDGQQPGWVASEFVDAANTRHTLIDKVPIFTTKLLDAASTYPQLGIVRCEVLTRFRDAQGRELVRITTNRPDGIQSTDSLSEFVVLHSQLSADKEVA